MPVRILLSVDDESRAIETPPIVLVDVVSITLMLPTMCGWPHARAPRRERDRFL